MYFCAFGNVFCLSLGECVLSAGIASEDTPALYIADSAGMEPVDVKPEVL